MSDVSLLAVDGASRSCSIEADVVADNSLGSAVEKAGAAVVVAEGLTKAGVAVLEVAGGLT